MKLTEGYARLGEPFTTPCELSPLIAPKWACWNQQAADELGLVKRGEPTNELLARFNGDVAAAPSPRASVYSGHQFGQWAGQLGDGRAALLGDWLKGDERFELQSKGSGPTEYSRGGDGRAVLRSSIREFLCSEAMHGLGIATTRALALIDSETPVERETVEKGALLIRYAPSHIRFGTFEHFAASGQTDHLTTLADYVIEHHHSHCETAPNPYLCLFETVIAQSAKLVAAWQAEGFAHGVLNTDNMSVLGLTMDYGPFGFMEHYNPGFVCNTSDYQGRYAFDAQPNMVLWNLAALGNALLELIPLEQAQQALGQFKAQFDAHYQTRMAKKLGFEKSHTQQQDQLATLLDLMAQNSVDYTRCFRLLARASTQDEALAMFKSKRDAMNQWLHDHRALLGDEDNPEARALAHSPKYILRNYMAQQAIDAANEGDYREIEALLKLLQNPFDEQPEAEHFFAEPPEWGRHIQVSCSA